MASYGKKTTYYQMPYLINGDILDEVQEEIIAKTIDDQLFGAMLTGGNGVVVEGTYSAFDPLTGTYNVILQASGGPALRGIVKYALCDTGTTLLWSGLATGSFYYLYVTSGPTMFYNPTDVLTLATTSPYPVNSTDYLLLATYDLTAGYPGTLNDNPVGKQYTTGISTHINNTVNPHSEDLTQARMLVTDHVILQQTSPVSTQAPLVIDNAGTAADIKRDRKSVV